MTSLQPPPGLTPPAASTGSVRSPRRWTAVLVLIAAAMVVGCGEDPPVADPGGGDGAGGEVVAASPDDIAFVGEEERPPTDDGQGGAETAGDPIGELLIVTVEAPLGEGLAGTVIVTVEDASLADRPASTVSEVRFPVAELDGNRIPINVPLPPDVGELTVAVHVDRDGSGAFSDGDLLSTTTIPLPPSSTGEIVVPVEVI